MKDLPMPAARIDADGNKRTMDSPYEQGVYFFVVGLSRSDNPFELSDAFNRRRFDQGYTDASEGRA